MKNFKHTENLWEFYNKHQYTHNLHAINTFYYTIFIIYLPMCPSLYLSISPFILSMCFKIKLQHQYTSY